MNIGIDARWLGAHGVGRYIANMIRELEALDQVHRYFVYCVPGDTRVDLSNERWQTRTFPGTPFLGSVQLWRDATWRHLDVFWATNQFLPRACTSTLFKVLTVHDLVWKRCPETMTAGNYLAHERRFSRSVRKADRIVAISNATRRDLIESTGVSAEKVLVIHAGIDPSFSRQEKSASARHIAQKYRSSENYICTVGTVEPRKDHVTLVRAMKILRDRGQLTHQLLIAGAPGWKNEQIYASLADCGLSEGEVKFLGKVPEEDLPKLYSGAGLFVYASLYEGFGFPLIEAMACGIPVVSSDAPAMPEVAGGAALLVPAGQAEAFADAISRVLEDERLHQGLVERGLTRSGDFSWATAAQAMLEVFQEAVKPALGPAEAGAR